MYYIVSLVNCHKHEMFITLWRHDNKGYCYSKENAGLYDNPIDGYHESEDNMKVEALKLEKLFMTVVYEGNEKMMIPNHISVWNTLGLHMKKNRLWRNKK